MSDSDSDSPLSSAPEDDLDEETLLPRQRRAKAAPKQKSKKKAATPPPASKPGPTKLPKIKLKAPVRSPSPPPKKRKKEPPHVYTLADSPELAFIIMFRSRFTDAFKGVPNLGPQDIENGVVDTTPSEQVETLLCRLLSLVLNRKKPVERGHHNRALEEAISAHQGHWPRSWEGRNPLPGTRTFNDLDPSGRLVLLKALVNWALLSSEQIRQMIAENYKGNRREDDLNVPLSVQPWGRDGDKRRYWLIEGRDDTCFRLYRESNPALKNIQWISVAGNISDLHSIAHDLEEFDGTKHALALKDRILSAIPRFEEGEVRRKKREYRQNRKNFFAQTNGVSLYEGRTRGKRIKYTFSDDEASKETTADPETEHSMEAKGTRRSGRSLRSSPGTNGAVPPQQDQPLFTASGRQIRKPNSSAATAIGEKTPYGTVVAKAGVGYAYVLEDARTEAQFSGAEDGNNTADDDEWNASGSEADNEDEKEVRKQVFDEKGERRSRVVELKIGNREGLRRILGGGEGPPGVGAESGKQEREEGEKSDEVKEAKEAKETKEQEDVEMVDAPPASSAHVENVAVGQTPPP
ncbi:hypothetical protein EX30DRAFT_371736 [Ascodesmis nigricans]|uniref:WHIM1 domain-containing protein n=1 Tax=Ascodesmis nigricans TaxID=341454 RepID=A0A4S2MWU9_9PEZI|nr:hypothetical protein EX30DRAFT_371736 [Ascodesmis nigricans]